PMNDEREEIKEQDDSIFKKEDRSERNDLWLGIVLALLLHLIQVPLALLTTGISLIFVGLSQLIYIIPAILFYRRDDRSDVVKGLIIVAAITFLLNATCTVLFFIAIRF